MIPWGGRLALVCGLAGAVGEAHADPGPVRRVVEPVDGDLQAAEQRLTQALRARGVPVERASWPVPAGFDPARLQVLEAVEGHLESARRARARLEDAAGLRELLTARDLLEADLALPGVSRWLAEVELQLGLLAAQMGRTELALQSFARAAALDHERTLAAAEAPPDTLALWRRAVDEQRQQRRARFVVDAQVPATVYLDDRRLGPVPQRAEVPPGRHLLRLRAEGHQPYAALLDVLPGERPEVHIVLAPDPGHVPAAPRVRAGERPAAWAERVRGYSARYPRAEVWWLRSPVEPGRGPALWHCAAGVCARQSELVALAPAPAAPPVSFLGDDHGEHRRAGRIAAWVATAVVLVAGAAVAATVRRPEAAPPQQVVTLDSGDLSP